MQQLDLQNVHPVIVHHRAIIFSEVPVVTVPYYQCRFNATHRCLLQHGELTVLHHLDLIAAVAPRNVTRLGHRKCRALQAQGVATGAVLLARWINARGLFDVYMGVRFDFRVTGNAGLTVVATGRFVGDGELEFTVAADDTRMMVELNGGKCRIHYCLETRETFTYKIQGNLSWSEFRRRQVPPKSGCF